MSGRFLPGLWLLPVVVCVGGCAGPRTISLSPTGSPVTPPPVPVQVVAREPGLTRAQVLERFRERATPDQLREFERARTRSDFESRERAFNLVVGQLKDWEVMELGVIPGMLPQHWAVAVVEIDAGAGRVIERLLQEAHIENSQGPPQHLRSLWYVRWDQFYRARQLLFTAPELRALQVRLIQPGFSLD